MAVALAAMAGVPEAARAASTGAAGFTRIDVPGDTASRGDAANRLHVVVWYPAAAGTPVRPIDVGPPGDAYFSEGEAAEDAPLAASPVRFPFVVISHGTGGTAMDLAWLCAGLAAHGYVVASVEHPGNNALEAPTVAGYTLWNLRANDLSRTIDGVLATARFGSRIDTARIGAAGFSFGGFTVLEVAGARADAARFAAYCAARPDTPVCTGDATPMLPDVAGKAQALAASDAGFRAELDAVSGSSRDPRVRAVFSIAPALGPAMLPASLAAIHIPVAILAGREDPILPVDDNAVADARRIAGVELTLLPKPAGHYTFLTDCTASGAAKFAPICADAGPYRVSVHRTALDLALKFFDRTLAGGAV